MIQERGTRRNMRDDRGYGGGGYGGSGYSDRKLRANDGRSVKVRGLPYSTSESELSEFFSMYNVSGHTLNFLSLFFFLFLILYARTHACIYLLNFDHSSCE